MAANFQNLLGLLAFIACFLRKLQADLVLFPDPDDVIRLKYDKNVIPFAEINESLLTFHPEKTLLEMKMSAMKENPKVFSFNIVSRDGFPYHETTQLKYITEDSFCIVINNTDFYMVLRFGDEDIFDNESQPLKDSGIQSLLTTFGSTAGKSSILSNFVNHVISEILRNKSPRDTINAHTLKQIIESKIQKDSLNLKFDIQTINLLLEVLHEKKQIIEGLKTNVEKNFTRKSTKRLKFLYSIIFLQMFFTQYGTYVKYSWDIMEPITCLFGIFDSIMAYSFWMMNNSDYSFEKFEKRYIEENTSRYFSKHFNVNQQLEDINRMISHLDLWKSLHSESLPEILEALDSKFAEAKSV